MAKKENDFLDDEIYWELLKTAHFLKLAQTVGKSSPKRKATGLGWLSFVFSS
jgi:hypothetical protein